MGAPHAPVRERFWRYVDMTLNCWYWTGTITANGYGSIHEGARHLMAHRVAYEQMVGPIPAGLDIDHLCRVRRCVNPAHLEPVTRRENLLRGETLAAAHHAGRDCGNAACKNCRRFR